MWSIHWLEPNRLAACARPDDLAALAAHGIRLVVNLHEATARSGRARPPRAGRGAPARARLHGAVALPARPRRARDRAGARERDAGGRPLRRRSRPHRYAAGQLPGQAGPRARRRRRARARGAPRGRSRPPSRSPPWPPSPRRWCAPGASAACACCASPADGCWSSTTRTRRPARATGCSRGAAESAARRSPRRPSGRCARRRVSRWGVRRAAHTAGGAVPGHHVLFLAEPLVDAEPRPTVDLAAERYLRAAAWHPVTLGEPLGPLTPVFCGSTSLLGSPGCCATTVRRPRPGEPRTDRRPRCSSPTTPTPDPSAPKAE